MARRVRKIVFAVLAGLLLVLGCVLLGVIPVNLALIKPVLNDFVAEQTGLSLDIQGPIKIRLGPSPAFQASAVTIRLPGHEQEPFASFDHLDIKPALMEWLRNDNIHLHRVTLSGLTVDYCQALPPIPANPGSEPGEAEWPSIAVDALSIDPIHPVCSQAGEKVGWLPEFLILKAAAASGRPTELSLKNTSDQLPMSFSVESASIDELLGGPVELPLTLEANAFDTQLAFSGIASSLTSQAELNGDLQFNTTDLSALLERFGLEAGGFKALTLESALHLDAQVIGVDQTHGSLDGVPFRLAATARDYQTQPRIEVGGELTLAGSRVSGDVSFDSGLPCPPLTTDLSALDIDFEKLFSLLKLEPGFTGQSEGIQFKSRSCGSSPEQHLHSLQADIGLQGFIPDFGDETLPLAFNEIRAEIGWTQPLQAHVEGVWLAQEFQAELSLGDMASLWRDHLSNIGLSLQSAKNTFVASGNINYSAEIPEIQLDLSADIPRLGALRNWIDIAPDNSLPFNGRTRLQLGQDGLFLNGLTLQLGLSDIKGEAQWLGLKSPEPAHITIHSNRIDLGELNAILRPSPPEESAATAAWTDLLGQSEWLSAWLDLPPVRVSASIRQINGLSYKISDTEFRFGFRDRMIEDGRLALKIDGMSLEGLLNANLQELPWSATFDSTLHDVDYGSFLESLDLAQGVDARASEMAMKLSSNGSTLMDLATNLQIQAQIRNLVWNYSLGPDDRDFQAQMEHLELLTLDDSTLSWNTAGTISGLPILLWLKTPPLKSLFEKDSKLPLTVVFGSGNDVTMLEAVVDRADPAQFTIETSLSGQFVDPQGMDLSELKPPLGDYELDARLRISETELHANNIKLRVGSSTVAGDIDIAFTDPGHAITVDLTSPFLETNDLVLWAQEFRNAHQHLGKVDTAEDSSDEGGGLITLAINFFDDLVDSDHFDIHLNIDELRAGGELLGHARMEGKVRGREFRLDPFEIDLPGGNVKVIYFGKAIQDGFESGLDIFVEELEYGDLLQLINPESTSRGRLFLDTTLTSHSPSSASAVDHLEGPFDIVIFPEEIKAGFLDLWASNLVFALLPGDDSNKKLNCMVGRFEVENGVMRSQNTFLDSTEIIVRARGDIDLAERQLNLRVAPQAKREKFLSVSAPIEVKGPFSDFKVEVAPGGFINTMLRWYLNLIYVPWKWISGERFPEDGIATCYNAMDWELPDS